MIRKILAGSLLAASMGAFADYTSDSDGRLISESNIEQELRETVECLSTASGVVEKCDLSYPKETFPEGGDDGEITSAFSGVISSSDDLIAQGKTLSGLSKIYVRYSGVENSATLPSEFIHTQSCEYVKSIVEKEFADEHNPARPAVLQPEDPGMVFNKSAYYKCEGSDALDIAATSISGSTQVSTGKENVNNVSVDVTCYGKSNFFNLGTDTSCGIYGGYMVWARNGAMGPATNDSSVNDAGICTNVRVGGYFNCTLNVTQTWDYEYKRHYEVTASPLTLDANSQSGVVDDIEYEVTIDYVYQKQRTLPVAQWSKGWVPIQVGDITTFIWAPVGPSYRISTYPTNIADRVYRSVTAKNDTQLTIGCDAESRTFDMTNKSGTPTLESYDLANLINQAKCNEITVSIDDLTPVNNKSVYWKVEYEWSPEEKLVWQKYAVFLKEQISDQLISSDYIAQLRNATYESTLDSQLIIKTLSEYIIGHNVDPANFVFAPSGLWSYLLAEGDNYDINNDDDILAEIESLVARDDEDYGQVIFNFNESGEVVRDSLEGEEGVKPAYWTAFTRSSHASNINFLDKYNLLKQAKNIIDVSDGTVEGDTSTLQDQMDVVALAAETIRFDTIDKAERFLGNMSLRSDIEANLCNELNSIREELDLTLETCDL